MEGTEAFQFPFMALLKFHIPFINLNKVGCRTIVIEPTQLGEDTARWITIGDLFHKTALLSGFGSFAIGKTMSLKRL